MGKHYGMFGGKSESGGGDVIIVDNIEKCRTNQGAEKVQCSLDRLIAPSFYKVHNSIEDYTHFWLCGGRGSTKSSFVSVEIYTRYYEKVPIQMRLYCVRSVLT